MVTSVKDRSDGLPYNMEKIEGYDHFHAKNLHQFFETHGHRQGCAVLGFQTHDVDRIAEAYRQKHPGLVRAGFPIDYGDVRIFEAYAYYNQGQRADLGTVVGSCRSPVLVAM